MSALSAGLWGLAAASSLLLGAAIAYWLEVPARVTGLIMGFGAGTLLSAIAYELIPDVPSRDDMLSIGLSLMAGALVYVVADWLIDKRGGAARSHVSGPGAGAGLAGAARSIVLGTLLDGIPESLVLGMGLALGGEISVAYLVAVFLSNLPEAMAGTTGLLASGDRPATVFGLWTGLAAASAAAAAIGYVIVTEMTTASGEMVQAFAAGATIVMLADAFLPQAYEQGGRAAGFVTAVGFLVSLTLSGAA
ncbi:MAG TPA: hypothetical protein VJM33_12085 [Microthrixaceae bacterium]|nr:hypothetical protein [Microthrixaceae bacterium]